MMENSSVAPHVLAATRRYGGARAVTASAVLATVGLGAAGWVVTLQRTNGMDMGVATRLGSFPSFLSVWAPMMAAMMLPGAGPAAMRLVRSGGRVLDIPGYVGSYLGIWVLAGAVVFALYRPHGTAMAGALTVAAGAYELTPLKGRFRRMCLERSSSGLGLGLCCIGSTAGLMMLMLALGAMSLTWMAVVAGVVLLQKLLPPRAVLDVPVAMAIVALGVVVALAPSSVPGLVQPM